MAKTHADPNALPGIAGVYTKIGVIGVVTVLLAYTIIRGEVNAAAERAANREDRAAMLGDARIAHDNLAKLVNTLEKHSTSLDRNTLAIWKLVDEVRAAKMEIGPFKDDAKAKE